jgi:glycosyltransferase involved in cell wall biosynthesis
MKFALVTTNLRGGGAEKAMCKLASLLAGRGHEAHIILLEHLLEHPVPEGVRLSALTRPGQAASKGFIGKRWLALRLRSHVARLTSPQPFDLILSTLPFADEVSKLARLPRLWHRIANTLSAEVEKLALHSPAKAARRLEKYRKLYDRARLVAVSDGVADDLRQMNIAAQRIERVYSPFDRAALKRQAAEHAELPTELTTFPYLLHVGRHAPQKRHDLLLDAFATLPPSHRLVLLCHDDASLQGMIRERGLAGRVLVAGFLPNPYPWMARADLLVLCSDHEGMPNVLVEALLLGTPVVSTDCPSGPREVLRDGACGVLVPCGDAAALANAMREALAGENLALRFDSTPFLPDAIAAQLERLAAGAD